MNLEELRAKIDGIDDTLVQAFLQRMEVVAQVAQEKKAQGLPTLDPAREREKLADIAAKLPPELAQYGYALWSMLFEISRGYQHAVNPQPSALRKEIESAMESTPNLFPPSATVACQGVEGAYSQLACEKMFKHPQVMYFGSFESVFSAIENGFCDYGVLPLENSTAGSVKQIYDLMLRHSSFKIVRSTRLKVDHNLVAKQGTKLEDIKEIYSHPQAISQCTAFLEKLGKDVKVTPCENTAAAAAAVAAVRPHRRGRHLLPPLHRALRPGAAGRRHPGPRATTTPGSSASPRSWRSTPGRTRPRLMVVLPHRARLPVSDPGPVLCPGPEPDQAGEPPPPRPGVRVHVLFRPGDFGLLRRVHPHGGRPVRHLRGVPVSGQLQRGDLMRCGLLGEKLGHSYSPALHAALWRLRLRAF